MCVGVGGGEGGLKHCIWLKIYLTFYIVEDLAFLSNGVKFYDDKELRPWQGNFIFNEPAIVIAIFSMCIIIERHSCFITQIPSITI